jgi:hypothetical protein
MNGWREGGAESEVLLELARFERARAVSAEALAQQRFLSAFRERPPSRGVSWSQRRVVAFGLALAAAITLVVGGLGLGAERSERALSYRVSDAPAPDGTLIEAKKGPIGVKFSDGTAVTVEHGSSARIIETTRRGAHLALDSGRVTMDVVPHAERGDWSIDAGPYRVRVTGTVFMVEWRASDGFFRVAVSRGHVLVDGEGQHRELSAGETFEHVDHPAAPTTEVPTGAPEAAGTPAPPAPTLSSTSTPLPREGAQTPSWSRLVGMGRFAAVLSAAEQRGLPACFGSCSPDDLQALADAARLSGKAALARQALLAQRSRFGGSANARAAAFILGRLAEPTDPAQAGQWYGTYLTESPQGRFASDALGRKMVLASHTNRAAAVQLATEYLQRFPTGAYASFGHSLIEAAEAPP